MDPMAVIKNIVLGNDPFAACALLLALSTSVALVAKIFIHRVRLRTTA